jgi:hypothetical protein
MASTLKVDRIESPAGINVGNISFGNPISGDGSQLTDLNIAGANMSWTNAVIPAGQLSGTITSGVDGSGLVNLPAVPPDLTATNAWTGPQRATLVTNATGPFDMDTGQNFLCTPTAPLSLTFSNPANGQSGYIILDNSVTGHAISKPATTKTDTNMLATVTAAGIYIISYISDGTTTYLTNSAAMV